MKDTVKIKNKGKTLIIAHRGASGLERENTYPAFVAAGNRSYYGVECDVWATSDGKYAVFHDRDTGRLCDKSLIPNEADFDSLRALKIREADGENFSEILKIPTPEEYLSAVARYGKTAVIELKGEMSVQNVKDILQICEKNYSLDKIIFISFGFDNLVKIRDIAPLQTVQLLVWKWSDDLPALLEKNKFGLDIYYKEIDGEKISLLHEKGVKVNCWTVDELSEAEKLISYGIDFITSNILE